MKLWHMQCIKALLTKLLIATSLTIFISSVYLIQRNYNKDLLLKFDDKQYLRGSKEVHVKETIIGLPEETNVITELPKGTCTKQIAVISPGLNRIKHFGHIKERFLPENGTPQLNMMCAGQGCNVTVGVIWTNRDFLKNSDGVFLFYREEWNLNHTLTELSAVGRNDTTFIFYNLESPLLTSFEITADALYGIDATYHSHSSLPSPYGYYDSSNPTDTIPVKDWTRNKTHLITWMASNCWHTTWPRAEFVRDLRYHISIDMYGKCGDLSCTRDKGNECKVMMEKYKFYLALENSECDEYITEKFWDTALRHGIVPVVYGGRRAAYEKLAPPNSFIHVADFSSTKELADYLLELDKNDTKYNEYFHWRLHGRVVYKPAYFQFPNVFCQLTPFLSSTEDQIIRKVSESEYFNSCRGRPGSTNKPSYETWKPWN